MATAKKKEGIVKIGQKEYKTVALRVNEFREEHGTEMALITSIVSINDSVVLMKAEVMNEAGNVVATGFAEEYRSASKVNRTSAVENAETSAIGRALANLGFGGTEFASANEVEHAIVKQETYADPSQVQAIQGLLNDGVITAEHLVRSFGHAEVPKLLATEAARILAALEKAQQQAGE